MPEGRMPQVVRQRNRLGQVFIQRQSARNRPRDIRHLKGMR
jgi:hypothetical protein